MGSSRPARRVAFAIEDKRQLTLTSKDQGRPPRTLISVPSEHGDLCLRVPPRCQCSRSGLDIGSHCWIIPEPVNAGGGGAYWRGNMAPRGTPGSRWNMATEHYPEDDKTGFSPSLRPGRGAPIGWCWWAWWLPWGYCHRGLVRREDDHLERSEGDDDEGGDKFNWC